jgi:hypothetical protein
MEEACKVLFELSAVALSFRYQVVGGKGGHTKRLRCCRGESSKKGELVEQNTITTIIVMEETNPEGDHPEFPTYSGCSRVWGGTSMRVSPLQ